MGKNKLAEKKMVEQTVACLREELGEDLFQGLAEYIKLVDDLAANLTEEQLRSVGSVKNELPNNFPDWDEEDWEDLRRDVHKRRIWVDIVKNNADHIRIYDYTAYEPDKGNNGGAYGFWKDFIKLPSGKWEVSYGTTADMDFCPVCGSFNDHSIGEGEYSCGEFAAVTEGDLLRKIGNFQETEKSYISIV